MPPETVPGWKESSGLLRSTQSQREAATWRCTGANQRLKDGKTGPEQGKVERGRWRERRQRVTERPRNRDPGLGHRGGDVERKKEMEKQRSPEREMGLGVGAGRRKKKRKEIESESENV